MSSIWFEKSTDGELGPKMERLASDLRFCFDGSKR